MPSPTVQYNLMSDMNKSLLSFLHECLMQDLDNFRKEVYLMSRVNHPNVVPLVAARVLPPGMP